MAEPSAVEGEHLNGAMDPQTDRALLLGIAARVGRIDAEQEARNDLVIELKEAVDELSRKLGAIEGSVKRTFDEAISAFQKISKDSDAAQGKLVEAVTSAFREELKRIVSDAIGERAPASFVR